MTQNRRVRPIMLKLGCVCRLRVELREIKKSPKYTVEELFYGNKYGIMGEVVKQVFARQKEFIAAPHTFRKLEIVRQTLIATEKMKKKR